MRGRRHQRRLGAPLAVLAGAATVVLPAGDSWAGFTASGGPSVRVLANEQVEVRWIADFVGDGRVELFDNPDGTGTPIDAKGTVASRNDLTVTFYVGALVRPDTTYYFRVTHRDPTGNLPDLTNAPPLPRLFTGVQAVGDVVVEVGLDRARISWDANVIGFGRLGYGLASPEEHAVEDGLNVEAHSIELTGLAPGTTYQFRVGNRHAVDGAILVEKTSSFTTMSAKGGMPSTFSLDPKRTYLRTNGDAALDALKIDLGALGMAGGSTVRLERLGAYDCGSPCVDDRVGIIAVFSAGDVLLAPDQRHRVPGAIEADGDVVTASTWSGGLPTDIPEDFAIADTTIHVPDGATHLLVGTADSLYLDNTDPNGDFAVRISLSNPTAVEDSYGVDEDTALEVPVSGVLANDADPQGQPLSAVVLTGPASGSLSLRPDGSFMYTPNPNFNGSDSFTYTASDGIADSAPATVTIIVNAINDAPVAVDDSYSVDEDASVTVAAPGVTGNDGDVEGDALAALLVSPPAHGAVSLGAAGSFAYTPEANFNGVDSFTYRASDGAVESAEATVAITVNPVDDAPVAAADGPYLGIVDRALTLDGSASNDVEGAPLTYRWDFGDGSTLVTTSPAPTHTYVAAGIYTITLVVSDGGLDSPPATTSATIGSPIGSGRDDVDAFLAYASPDERTVHLPAGTTSFDVTILYGPSIMTATFGAELEGSPFTAFTPAPGTAETVTIPLAPGRNVLALSVDGTLADGRTATDRDRLTIVVA